MGEEAGTHGVIGMLDFMRDPRAEGVAPPKALGDVDADTPLCSTLGDLAELARSSFRNCSLFILGWPGPSRGPWGGKETGILGQKVEGSRSASGLRHEP